MLILDRNRLLFSKSNFYVTNGTSVTLECNTDQFVNWLFKRTRKIPGISKVMGTYGEKLKLFSVSSLNKGFYYCYGQYTSSGLYFMSNIELKINSKYFLFNT